MLPDLVSLALFVRTVDGGSLSKAAEQSHIALSAASRRIALLESRFGAPLLHRTARGAEPTAAGLALAAHARRVLRETDRMQADLSDYAQGMKGRVRLQANTSVMSQFLPHDLAAFSRRYPEIKLEIQERLSAEIALSLRDGSADVGVILGSAATDGLRCLPYRTDQLVAVVPRSHRLRGKRADFARLLDYDLVGLEGNTAMSRLLEDAAAAAGKPLRLRVQVKSFEVVCRMIEAGLGIGVLPELAARSFSREMKLRLLPLTDPWAVRQMYVCVREGELPVPARNLVEHLAGDTGPSQSAKARLSNL